MNEEIDVLWRTSKCWTVVEIPVGVKLLTQRRYHFVFKIKFKNGKVMAVNSTRASPTVTRSLLL
jgi:hypothetical protein